MRARPKGFNSRPHWVPPDNWPNQEKKEKKKISAMKKTRLLFLRIAKGPVQIGKPKIRVD